MLDKLNSKDKDIKQNRVQVRTIENKQRQLQQDLYAQMKLTKNMADIISKQGKHETKIQENWLRQEEYEKSNDNAVRVINDTINFLNSEVVSLRSTV